MSRGKSSQDFGLLESKSLVVFILISSALTGCGLWKAWELLAMAWRMIHG